MLASRLLFRYGITELMGLSHQLKLPFYIVSGGISEIIEASFYAILHNGETGHKEQVLREFWDSHVRILSNNFLYKDGIGVSYSKPLVHILNKQKFIYDLAEAEMRKAYRKNVVIMGDILEDVKMVRESEHDVVLKIGFLNDMQKQGHMLEDFKNTFDIVITGDGSLQPVNYMLSKVFEKELQEGTHQVVDDEHLEH